MSYKEAEGKKEWYRRNKVRVARLQKERYKKTPERYKNISKEYYKNNKERWAGYYDRKKNNIKFRKYSKKRRLELVALLGGKCVKCGFDDWRALQVDHVNGGGNRAVKKLVGNKNIAIIKDIVGGSTEYQLLCANCNWIKRYENNENRI